MFIIVWRPFSAVTVTVEGQHLDWMLFSIYFLKSIEMLLAERKV